MSWATKKILGFLEQYWPKGSTIKNTKETRLIYNDVKTNNTAYQALVLVWLGCGNIKMSIHMFLPVAFVLEKEIDLLKQHMEIWSGTSCKLCQLS